MLRIQVAHVHSTFLRVEDAFLEPFIMQIYVILASMFAPDNLRGLYYAQGAREWLRDCGNGGAIRDAGVIPCLSGRCPGAEGCESSNARCSGFSPCSLLQPQSLGIGQSEHQGPPHDFRVARKHTHNLLCSECRRLRKLPGIQLSEGFPRTSLSFEDAQTHYSTKETVTVLWYS